MSRTRVALVVVWLAGCGARTILKVRTYLEDAADTIDAGTTEPADAFVADGGTTDAWYLDGGDPCGVDRSPLVGMICEESIVAHNLSISCTDVVDVLAQGEGILRWECNGHRAEASFASGVYHGTRTGHSFALCTSTQFGKGDQCQWLSSQRIDGTLDRGEIMMSYHDSVILSDGACNAPCTATEVIGHP